MSDRPAAGRPGRLGKVLRCIIFLGLLYFGALAFTYIVRQTPTRFAKERFPAFYAEPDYKYSVVELGSSACNRYLDPFVLYEKFGILSYNLGTPLQPPVSTSFIMDEVEKSQDPELYVVECREFLFLEEDKLEQALYCVTDSMDVSLTKWQMISRAYDTLGEKITAFFDIVKYHSYWPRIQEYHLQFWDNRKLSDIKSWDPHEGYRVFEAPDLKSLEYEPLDEENEALLRELLGICTEKKRKVLFVVVPYTRSKYIKHSGRIQALKKIVEEYGFDFLDLTDGEAYGLDYSRDFHDVRHVNNVGADKVTNELGKYIKEQYGITSDIPDEMKAVWDEAARKNREAIEYHAANPQALDETEDTAHLFDV